VEREKGGEYGANIVYILCKWKKIISVELFLPSGERRG
jgi:hypothetical protein